MPRQPHQAGTQRAADRNFPPAGLGSRQQKVGYIYARDQEHKDHGAKQHQECGPNTRNHFCLQRKADDSVSFWVEAMRLGRSFLAITLNQRGQLSLSFDRRDSRLHPAKQIIVVATAVTRIRWIQS